MKKFFILLMVVYSFVWADSNLTIKSGWQLIGFERDLDDMSVFDNENVEQVWIFDAVSKKWSGYAPDITLQNKIETSHSLISTIDKWQGVWIKSTQEWYLTLEAEETSSTPIDTIELIKGWNLISIPIDSTLSPRIFGKGVVWKYSSNDWKISDANSTSKFKTIENINSGDGVWIKVEKDKTVDISKQSARLQTFGSKSEMVEYIDSMNKVHNCIILIDNTTWMPSLIDTTIMLPDEPINTIFISTDITTTAVEDSVENITTTNLQEEGVDESDLIKSNGKYIYFINKTSKTIDIRSFDSLTDNNSEIIKQINISSNMNINSFYLYKNRLIVLSQLGINNDEINIDIYNIEDIDDIYKEETFLMDGYLNSTRIINDKLIVVSNYSPYVGKKDIYCDFSLSIDNNSINPTAEEKHLIPQLKYSQYDGDLIDYKSFYAPYKKNQASTITTISSFSLDTLSFEKSSSIIGHSSTIYASTNALYIFSEDYPIYYNSQVQEKRTVIYKFDISKDLKFRAIGFIQGNLLSPYSVSEYNSILRVATTDFSRGKIKNSISTLEENNFDLETIGYLDNIGKYRETIRAVRFMQDRAFVVTFRQTDPLYTIDLSEPSNPKKVGELEIDGFSQYMHLIDDNRLLTIGRDTNSWGWNQGIFAELFDISDFADPKLVSKKVIGDSQYSSEALTNPKAFIYRKNDNLFAFPYMSRRDQVNTLGVYQVDGLSIKSVVDINSTYSYGSKGRGLIFDYDDTTYGSYFCNDTVITKKIGEE